MTSAPDPTVRIDIPARPGYVGVARLALSSLARQAGFDEERVDELKIVISEACTNAVMAHDESGATDESIELRWALSDGGVALEIEDRAGQPPEVTLEDSQGFSTRQAMSVALLRSLVNDYETIPGPTGTTTRLTL